MIQGILNSEQSILSLVAQHIALIVMLLVIPLISSSPERAEPLWPPQKLSCRRARFGDTFS